MYGGGTAEVRRRGGGGQTDMGKRADGILKAFLLEERYGQGAFGREISKNGMESPVFFIFMAGTLLI
jgi:hypothetical protein